MTQESNTILSVLYTTIETQEDAERLATQAIEAKLAACVNISTSSQSIYQWEGKIEKQKEYYLLFKTMPEHIDQLKQWVIKNHPYTLPAILVWEVHTSEEYYQYLKSMCA